MGTSGSKPDGRKGSSLIPPWADQDPQRPPDAPPPEDGKPEIMPSPPPAPPPPEQTAPERRYQSFRAAYGNFARTGDAQSARVALGHYARTAAGGAKVNSARVARAARTGGAVLASFASSGATVTAAVVGFNIRALAGQPVEVAIAQIVGEFCPPGILDEEVARIAIGEALAVALESADVFDPDAIDDEAVRIATLTFVAELVFLEVAGNAGDALAQASNPAAAVQRELEIREFIREVADDVGSPVMATATRFTPASFSGLVTRLVELVNKELAKW